MRRRANREETTPRTNTRMLPMNRRQFITMKLEATPSPRLGRQLTPWFKGQVLTSSPLYFYSSIRVKIRFHIRELSSSIDFFLCPNDSPNDSDRARIYLFSFSIVKSCTVIRSTWFGSTCFSPVWLHSVHVPESVTFHSDSFYCAWFQLLFQLLFLDLHLHNFII